MSTDKLPVYVDEHFIVHIGVGDVGLGALLSAEFSAAHQKEPIIVVANESPPSTDDWQRLIESFEPKNLPTINERLFAFSNIPKKKRPRNNRKWKSYNKKKQKLKNQSRKKNRR